MLSKKFILIEAINLVFIIFALLAYFFGLTQDFLATIIASINFFVVLLVQGIYDYSEKRRPQILKLVSILVKFYNSSIDTFNQNVGLRLQRNLYYANKEEQPKFDDVFRTNILNNNTKSYILGFLKEAYGKKKSVFIFDKISNNVNTYYSFMDSLIIKTKVTDEERKLFSIDSHKKHTPHAK